MTAGGARDLERRVLVIAPTGKDAATTQALLASAGIPMETCATVAVLLEELARGAAVLLISEEAIAVASFRTRLAETLERQPAWSDLPVLVLTRQGARSPASAEAVRVLGNVTLLERPVQVATLLSAIRTALRARDRQIQVRDLLRERGRSEQSLRLADRRKDEFLATLGHELRNPLAPLVSGLHLLKTSGTADARVLGVALVMERQIQHLVRLVDDLLEISRITRGLVDIQRQPLDLGFAIQSAIDTSRPLLTAADHVLVVDLPTEPVTVAGDAVRLTQVFANLLTNAAKYTNSGGTVWLTLKRVGDRAYVSVRDNGIGIPATQLESVFDMFMQVDRSDRRAQGGLGIGLTLVRSLVQLHGGRVEARSAGVGQGSEFLVELPVMPERLVETGASARLSAFPARRLLVVDDNHDAADMLAALLTMLGVTVAVANSGEQALDTLATFAPDAVLLDIGMPGMDGYATARRMRQTSRGAELMLIALTGWGQDQDVQQAYAAGFDHHLVKPPDMDKLRALLAADGERQPRVR